MRGAVIEGKGKDLRNRLLTIAKEENPRSAISILKKEVERDKSALKTCHDLLHQIGRESYKSYGDFAQAFQYTDDFCLSGYIHGVLEEYFKSEENIEDATKGVCNKYLPGTFLALQWYHGVGHGLMYYTLNDLPRALSLCDSYELAFAREFCLYGVFMENANADGRLSFSKYLKSEDPRYPCPLQHASHKKACYFFALRHYLRTHKDRYSDALAWCKKAESAFQSDCISGVSFKAMNDHTGDPKYVETICMNVAREEVAPCIEGIVLGYVLFFSSFEKAKEACKELYSENREICHDVVASTSQRMKDFR